MKHPDPLESGQDAVAIEVTPDGELVTTWSDGTTTATPANADLSDRIRNSGFATHLFLEPKRRKYPAPRI